ncbi:MAG: hypothetical protein SO359_02695 [Prevotella sp.]|nr:hypothetical protein [Prevotella sp.]
MIIIRLYDACGRSNERPYGLDEVGIFNNTLIIIRLYGACGRSNERPYELVRIACGLVRGRHKARPLHWRWFGAEARTSVPTGWMRLGVFNKSLIIIRLYDACGRSNERPNGLSEDSLRTGARPAQGSATTTDVDLRVEYGWDVRRLRGGLPTHVDVYYAGVSL